MSFFGFRAVRHCIADFRFAHLHVGSPHMDQISPQHLTMFLVEGDPGPDHLPGRVARIYDQSDLHLVAGLSNSR